MAASFSAPINAMGNALQDLQQSPKAQKIMFGLALAAQAAKHVPTDILSSTPHYDFEAYQKGR